MKFALILEAVDRASKAIKGVAVTQKAAAATAASAQETAARATAKAAKAQDAANRAAKSSVALAGQERRGIAAKTAELLRLNRAAELYRRTQDRINKGGLNTVRAGFGRAAAGARGAMGKALQLSAIGAGGQAGAAALFLKPAAQYSALKTQLAGVTKSAEAADKAMAWVMQRQMPPHGIMDMTAGFVALKRAGIDPTRGALQAAADSAAAHGKSIQDITEAMEAAFAGDYAGLAELGIQAENQGKYIAYTFKDADGRLKRIRASSRDTGAQAAAMAEAMRRAHEGAGAKAGQTWAGMAARLGDVFDRIRLKIMDNGLYDFIQKKIAFVNGELNKFLAKLEVWANDGRLQAKIQEITGKIERGFEIGWQVAMRFYRGAQQLYGVMDKAAGVMGGWDNLLTALIAVPFIPFILRIISGIGMMVSGISSLIALAAPLSTLFKVLTIGLRLAAAGFIRLGIAMMTTPIGWIIAGIAAVAAAAYLIYKNWDKIGPYFWALWDGVKNAVAGFWEWFKGLFTAGNISGIVIAAFMPLIGLPMLIYQNWDKILPYMAALWQGIKDNLAAVWAAISGAFADMWAGITGAAADAWDTLKALFSWDTISSAFETLKNGIIGVFADIWKYVGGVFDKVSAVWNKISGWFGGGNAAEASANAAASASKAANLPPALPTAAVQPALPAAPQSANVAAAPAQGGDVSVNFAPNISIQGAEPSAVKKAIDDVYAQFKRDLPRLIDEARRRQERLAY